MAAELDVNDDTRSARDDGALVRPFDGGRRRDRVDVSALVQGCVARANEGPTGPRARIVQNGAMPFVHANPRHAARALDVLLSAARRHGSETSEVLVELEASGPLVEVAVSAWGELPLRAVHVARRLVEAQGGDVRVQSQRGGMTTVRCELRSARPPSHA